jgi:hypothetical protein
MLGCLGTQAYAGSCPTRDQHGDPCVSAINNQALPMNDGKDTNFVITYSKNPSCRGSFRVWAETNEGEEKSNGFGDDNKSELNCTTTMGCSGMRNKFKFECTDNSPDSGSNTPAAVPAKPSQTSTPTPAPSATVPPPQTTLAPPQPSAPPRKFSLQECLGSAVSCHNSCQQTFGSHGSKQADAWLACNQSCTSQSSSCEASGNALVNTTTALDAGNGKSSQKESAPKPRQKTSKEHGTRNSGTSSAEKTAAYDKCGNESTRCIAQCASESPVINGDWIAANRKDHACWAARCTPPLNACLREAMRLYGK